MVLFVAGVQPGAALLRVFKRFFALSDSQMEAHRLRTVIVILARNDKNVSLIAVRLQTNIQLNFTVGNPARLRRTRHARLAKDSVKSAILQSYFFFTDRVFEPFASALAVHATHFEDVREVCRKLYR